VPQALQRMCQLKFCTTVHQNSQLAINYAFNIEWISDGMAGLLQKYAYKSYAGCDFDEQIAELESSERLEYFP
jgi:hypothetical protein